MVCLCLPFSKGMMKTNSLHEFLGDLDLKYILCMEIVPFFNEVPALRHPVKLRERFLVLNVNPRQYFAGQALCGNCRDETHRAKMFSQHDVIHMSKKTKELHRKVRKTNQVF